MTEERPHCFHHISADYVLGERFIRVRCCWCGLQLKKVYERKKPVGHGQYAPNYNGQNYQLLDYLTNLPNSDPCLEDSEKEDICLK